MLNVEGEGEDEASMIAASRVGMGGEEGSSEDVDDGSGAGEEGDRGGRGAAVDGWAGTAAPGV